VKLRLHISASCPVTNLPLEQSQKMCSLQICQTILVKDILAFKELCNKCFGQHEYRRMFGRAVSTDCISPSLRQIVSAASAVVCVRVQCEHASAILTTAVCQHSLLQRPAGCSLKTHSFCTAVSDVTCQSHGTLRSATSTCTLLQLTTTATF